MEQEQIIKFLISSHRSLTSILKHNLGGESIKEWKSKLFPYLGKSSKIKISRIKILHIPLNSYSISMYTDPHERAVAETVLLDSIFKNSEKKTKEDTEALKILQARENNIDFEQELAEMICGSSNSFPSRNRDQLTKFFQDLGHDFTNEGGYGSEWVKEQLEELAVKRIHTLISTGLFRKKYFNVPNVSYDNAVKEFKSFIHDSINVNQSLDLGAVLDMSVNVELLFDNKANTKDQTLNELIEEAKERYINNDKQVALEKLWDAYERIKTYFSSEGLNKKLSAQKLSESISQHFDKEFIDEEFSRLSNIGNGYRIRHHETGKNELTPEHINYFFFRMLSFIDLCLVFLNEEDTEEEGLF